jgi:hypothetical protein
MDKSILRNEIITCGRDPVYFIKKYVQIQHPKRGLIPFKLFDYQEKLLHDYVTDRFNIILKSRQIGISEVTAAYAVWLMLFHKDKNILVMASKAETAKNIIKKVKTSFKYIPEWLMLADVITDNRFSVELSNGSQIKAIATAHDAGRSEALSLLIIDEAAFVIGLDELWTGLYPTVAAGGNVIILSTPNGVGNKFHQLYEEAADGLNEFKTTKLMWWVHPERIAGLRDDPDRPGFKTSPWYKHEIGAANMSPRDIAQELECNFNASGDTMVSSEMIDCLEQGVIEPISREHWDRGLSIWWNPQSNKRYFISADVARGDGKDYSACHVWDIDTMDQCAEYYGKIPVEEYAKLMVDLGHRYNNAMLVIENNSIGLACLEHVRLLGYENVYYSMKGDEKAGQSVNTTWGPPNGDLVIGFVMSPKTRPLVMSKLEEYIRNRLMFVRSKRLIAELRTFIWKDGKPQAMRGYNDDLVLSAGIGCWIRDTVLMPNVNAEKAEHKLLNGISVMKNVNTDIVGASKDPRYVKQATMGAFAVERKNPYTVSLPNGKQIDFTWVISKG